MVHHSRAAQVNLGSAISASSDYSIVFSVTADPSPQNTVFDLGAQRPIVQTYSDRPVVSDSLEVERGMTWIGYQ